MGDQASQKIVKSTRMLKDRGMIINGGKGDYSNGELHEHGDQWRMVENQEEVPKIVVGQWKQEQKREENMKGCF